MKLNYIHNKVWDEITCSRWSFGIRYVILIRILLAIRLSIHVGIKVNILVTGSLLIYIKHSALCVALNYGFQANYATPSYGVDIICHQVRCLR